MILFAHLYNPNVADRSIEHLRAIAQSPAFDRDIAAAFLSRAEQGDLTRDENPYTHFCVYFAAYDPGAREVFIGHHKKSGLWLFTGGHMDKGEVPSETLEREIGEEWGKQMKADDIGDPALLTITEIDNPAKQTCVRHYDIWYFVPVQKATFDPAPDLLGIEFHQTRWLPPLQAREVVTDPNTLKAVDALEAIFHK